MVDRRGVMMGLTVKSFVHQNLVLDRSFHLVFDLLGGPHVHQSRIEVAAPVSVRKGRLGSTEGNDDSLIRPVVHNTFQQIHRCTTVHKTERRWL